MLAGKNPHAVDAAAACLIGLKLQQVTTLAAAMQRGLLPEYEIVGDDMQPLMIRDFDIPMKLRRGSWVRLMNGLPQALRPRPVFTHRRCDGCGTCVRVCPAHAISMNEARRPQVKLDTCIRCYCCQELCPKNDVQVRRNPLFSLMK